MKAFNFEIIKYYTGIQSVRFQCRCTKAFSLIYQPTSCGKFVCCLVLLNAVSLLKATITVFPLLHIMRVDAVCMNLWLLLHSMQLFASIK